MRNVWIVGPQVLYDIVERTVVVEIKKKRDIEGGLISRDKIGTGEKKEGDKNLSRG